MLELDLLLVPFVEHHLRDQDHSDQLCYRALLEEEDQDLFAWLVQRSTPPQPLARIVSLIQQSRRAPHKV